MFDKVIVNFQAKPMMEIGLQYSSIRVLIQYPTGSMYRVIDYYDVTVLGCRHGKYFDLLYGSTSSCEVICDDSYDISDAIRNAEWSLDPNAGYATILPDTIRRAMPWAVGIKFPTTVPK